MLQHNVEVALRANAAFNRGDMHGALQDFAPGAELQDLANGPDQARVAQGLDSILEAWGLWSAAFDELRAEVEEWAGAGDVVVGSIHWHGRGKGSGLSIDERQFDRYEFRDGKIVRVILGFKSKEQALEGGGLQE
jgi:ketosteroid isomerase-like protein